MKRLSLSVVGIVPLAATICMAGPQESRAEGAGLAAVGPRGPVGPEVRMAESEKRQLGRRVTVEGRTGEAVEAACEHALKEGIPVVFLPAGEYSFETAVEVPSGLTLLGEGARTLIHTKNGNTHLFHVAGDHVRFTRLKLQGADTTPSTENNTCGIAVSGKRDVRVDHCELFGFRYALNFVDEASAQVDHCLIHDNLRAGQGYGVVLLSGAYVLITDNEFSQNRHSLASNGALDWSSPKRVGKYLHKPGVRKTHWEFRHNRVGGNDLSRYELCAVDAHPGMDGSFVVEDNVFENLRHGVGIRDGSGLIRGNLFRNLRTVSAFRSLVGISAGYGTHNNVPVDGCMPHDISIAGNSFLDMGDKKYEKYRLGKAENIAIDGKLVPETKVHRPAPAFTVRLQGMGEEGILRWRQVRPTSPATGGVTGTVTDPAGKPVGEATSRGGEQDKRL